MKTDSNTRHGKRAEGMTTITFPCSEALKSEIVALAQAEHRSVAQWIRLHLSDTARRSRAARAGKKASVFAA